MQLEGKTALVTGGSRGIGRACVEVLAARGAEVWFVYNSNQEAAQSLVDELAAKGLKAHAVQADVADGDRAQEVVDQVVEEGGRLDILVNSAGIIRDGLLSMMTPDQWADVINTNLTGTYNFCRAACQQMSSQRSGSIINLSSTASAYPSPGQVNYAASKGGINAFTKAMAKELSKRKVRVNAVAPGMIETDMSEAVRNAAGASIKKAIPMRKFGAPEEIATVVAFLASEDASYMTGQILFVDGGLSIGANITL